MSMEMHPVVLLAETGQIQLTSFSRHALYHTVSVLLPSQSLHTVLPKSGSIRIEMFCSNLIQAITTKHVCKKNSTAQSQSLGTNTLISSLEIHKFLERATTVNNFTFLLEKQLLELSGGDLNLDKVLSVCWGVYEMEKGQQLSRQCFSPMCAYRLWLVFCFVQEQPLGDTLSAVTANEVIKRLVELCGYTWNQAYNINGDSKELTFVEYLEAIGSNFKRLELEESLTSEVIVDMVDEVIHGVLKKGFLVKKGHKRKNWNKRWFVLQTSVMKYFENRESKNTKGQLILNSKTEVKGIPDRGKRKCIFEVTCGLSGKLFEISADDQRTRQEWILAIKKAIALAKVLDGSYEEDEFTQCLSGFYLHKYGTPQPALNRQDSSIRKMKYQATLKEQRARLGGNADCTLSGGGGWSKDEIEGSACHTIQKNSPDDDDVSDCDSENYTYMRPIDNVDNLTQRRCKSVDYLNPQVSGQIMKYGCDQNLDENISKACSLSTTLELTNPIQPAVRSEISLRSSFEELYIEAKVKQRYYPKDGQQGEYIDVAHAEQSSSKKKPFNYKSWSLPFLSNKDSGNGDIGRLTAQSRTLQVVSETRPSYSPEVYLTIIQHDNVNLRSGRRNEKDDTCSPPPIPDRRCSLPSDAAHVIKVDPRPPVKTRPKPQKLVTPETPERMFSRSIDSSPLHAPHTLIQRTSSPPIHSGPKTVTLDTDNNIPPLPPRD